MAGTATITTVAKGAAIRAIRFALVGDASDGTVPATALPAFAGELIALETDPGATAPTTLYDITLLDASGYDVLQGVGANRSATVTEKVAVVFTGTSVHPPIAGDDVLTLTIAGQSVNSAIINGTLYFRGSLA